jgi:hypothetical protein
VASAGHDAQVIFADIEQLVEHTTLPTRVYPCHSIVSSVQWHPTHTELCGATAETGVFHLIDTRNSTDAMLLDAHKTHLYTHAMINQHTVALGFADSTILLADIRHTKHTLCHINSPDQQPVGQLVYSLEKQTLAAFTKNNIFCYNTESSLSLTKTFGNTNSMGGVFIPSKPMLVISDSSSTSKIKILSI